MYGTSDKNHLAEYGWILTLREGDLVRVYGHAPTRNHAQEWYCDTPNAGYFGPASLAQYPIGRVWIEKDAWNERINMMTRDVMPWEETKH